MQLCYHKSNGGMRMNYRIETAKAEDLSRIGEIYAYARSFMAKTGNPNQWGSTHPPAAQLQKDVEHGKLYAVKLGEKICGVFYFAVEDDPTYHEISEGNWRSDKPYGVIHRIASDGSGGILKAAVEFASGHVDYLRIDTHADNHVMQRAVQKQGFQYCGIIYIADGTPRLAYDRK